jgi:hypothetical protein
LSPAGMSYDGVGGDVKQARPEQLEDEF